MELDEFESRLETLADEAETEIAESSTEDEAIKAKNAYLGRDGEVQDLMAKIGELPDDDRPEGGRTANETKERIEAAYGRRLEQLRQRELERRIERESVDVTLPARRPSSGPAHPITRATRQLVDVFTEMGFDVADGREIETDYYNFEALNFPKDHPARDMQDTFKMVDGRVLRTHTTPLQVRSLEAYEPPVRMVAPGRVFRCDDDVTHSPVFHQVDGYLVDEGVTFAQLKGALTHFATEIFGSETDVRFRPSYFPFTEPSAELDIGCIFCDAAGCRVCEDTGWIEILGAGMIDPNVLEHAELDPEAHSGFAFGMGVERVAMLAYGIDDIRLFFDNDLRFLEQF